MDRVELDCYTLYNPMFGRSPPPRLPVCSCSLVGLRYGAAAMATLEVEHTYNCSEATFWDRIFLDPEYNERLFKTELKFPVCREISREERGGQRKEGGEEAERTQHNAPNVSRV